MADSIIFCCGVTLETFKLFAGKTRLQYPPLTAPPSEKPSIRFEKQTAQMAG